MVSLSKWTNQFFNCSFTDHSGVEYKYVFSVQYSISSTWFVASGIVINLIKPNCNRLYTHTLFKHDNERCYICSSFCGNDLFYPLKNIDETCSLKYEAIFEKQCGNDEGYCMHIQARSVVLPMSHRSNNVSLFIYPWILYITGGYNCNTFINGVELKPILLYCICVE